MSEEHEFGFDTRGRCTLDSRPIRRPGRGRCRSMPLPLLYSTTPSTPPTLFALQTYGNIYSRIGNPTNAAFEERMASLEHGLGAVAVASGQSAQIISILTIAANGDEVVSSKALYGGTYTQLDVTLATYGCQRDVHRFRRT